MPCRIPLCWVFICDQFSSAPQLKRDPLGSAAESMRHLWILLGAVLACAPGPAPRNIVVLGSPTPRTSCTGLAPTDSAVYDSARVSEGPKLYDVPVLNYPVDVRAAGIQGRVVLDAVINTDGRAEGSSIKIVQSPDPRLGYEAEQWLLGAKFWPACLAGRPVRVRVKIPIDFTIHRQ